MVDVFVVANGGEEDAGDSKKKPVKAIEDDIYERVFEVLSSLEPVKLTHHYSKEDLRVYNLAKGGFKIAEVFNPVKKVRCQEIVDRNNKIIPKKSELNNIISFYYQTYKGEGANKLHYRIKVIFSGVPRRYIQTWLNSNPVHCQNNPKFNNKAPLKPVVSKTVQSHHQIDLVSMENYPVIIGESTYLYVLSVLDVFSRFAQLRAISSKEPPEILSHLKDIYR